MFHHCWYADEVDVGLVRHCGEESSIRKVKIGKLWIELCSHQQKQIPRLSAIICWKKIKKNFLWLVHFTQISCDRGFKKLKTPGFCFIGFFIIIDIPKDMNGLLKSITLSLSDVIVIGAMARSASWIKTPLKFLHYSPTPDNLRYVLAPQPFHPIHLSLHYFQPHIFHP